MSNVSKMRKTRPRQGRLDPNSLLTFTPHFPSSHVPLGPLFLSLLFLATLLPRRRVEWGKMGWCGIRRGVDEERRGKADPKPSSGESPQSRVKKERGTTEESPWVTSINPFHLSPTPPISSSSCTGVGRISISTHLVHSKPQFQVYERNDASQGLKSPAIEGSMSALRIDAHSTLQMRHFPVKLESEPSNARSELRLRCFLLLYIRTPFAAST
jgi:hypothetical protein